MTKLNGKIPFKIKDKMRAFHKEKMAGEACFLYERDIGFKGIKTDFLRSLIKR
jgi:hypothetical protein